MLRIRIEQIAVLEDAQVRRFARAISGHVREEAPRETAALSDDALEVALAELVRRGVAYGLAADCDLIAFSILGVSISPVFDAYPPFQQIFADRTLAPDRKMSTLFEGASDDDWSSASSVAGIP
jgi:hypothetical protein